ncbi:HEPN domain-containing protein [Rhodopila globiformis]|uniref:HEPN domain-containing protein n=1 Tax=Rhodopila globiformis TaxID=1071 RepID=UPI0019568E0C|nr:HEPN domain-containing protein [Rhodopila globiformis]
MAKAARAAESARALLDRGDADGACNRAYYAMFDAARAALLAVGHGLAKLTVACSTPSTSVW